MMKYTLLGKRKFGTKPFPIPFEKINLIRHGTFGCFDNFNNVLIARYITLNSDDEEVERLQIIGHFETGKTLWGGFFFRKNPVGVIYNFNSEWKEEDVLKLLEMSAELPDPYCK